jgi:hypothetical protein
MAGSLPIVSPMLTALASVSVVSRQPGAFSLDGGSGGGAGGSGGAVGKAAATRGGAGGSPPAASSKAAELNDPANYPFVVLDEPFAAAVKASAALGGGDARCGARAPARAGCTVHPSPLPAADAHVSAGATMLQPPAQRATANGQRRVASPSSLPDGTSRCAQLAAARGALPFSLSRTAATAATAWTSCTARRT